MAEKNWIKLAAVVQAFAFKINLIEILPHVYQTEQSGPSGTGALQYSLSFQDGNHFYESLPQITLLGFAEKS